MELTRQQVIAYRVRAQGLLREKTSADELAVLDIGLQDTSGSAALSLDARLRKSEPVPASLALAWTMRGAPHLHRRRDLDRHAAGLFPLSDADALARVDASASMRKAGIAGLDGFRTALEALRTIVTTPTGKGAASTALTKATPDGMHRYCRACRATHVFEMVLRVPTTAGGIELEPDTAPPVLVPRADAAQPDEPDLDALRGLVRAYLTLLGPGTVSDAADYFGIRRADLENAWPDDLVEVGVEGRRSWLPPEVASSLRRRRKTRLTRLLGAYDPYLQARDRDLIVPDAAVQKALWPVLGRPGVLFVDGEVVGTWRPKSAAKSRLQLAIEAFAPLPPAVRREVEDEAARVAAVRGAADVEVRWSD
jgi:DNA glycosylase AlkZ-like